MTKRRIWWFFLLLAVGLCVGSQYITWAQGRSKADTKQSATIREKMSREFAGYLMIDRWDQVILLRDHTCAFIDPALMGKIKDYLGNHVIINAEEIGRSSMIPPRNLMITQISKIELDKPGSDFDLAIALDKSRYFEKEMMSLQIRLATAEDRTTVISPHSFFVCFASKRKDYSGAGVAKGIGDMALFCYRDGFIDVKANTRLHRGTIRRKLGISSDVLLRHGNAFRRPTTADYQVYRKQLQMYNTQVIAEPNSQMCCRIGLDGILPRGEYEVYLWYAHPKRQMSNILRIDVDKAPDGVKPNILPWGPWQGAMKVRIEPEKSIYQKDEAIGVWGQFYNDHEFSPIFYVDNYPFHIWDDKGQEVTPPIQLSQKDYELISVRNGPSLLKYFELSPGVWGLSSGRRYCLQARFEYKDEPARTDLFRGPLESNKVIIEIRE